MTKRDVLQDWVVAAPNAHSGSASIVQVAAHIWANHENELRASGELFFAWQYDMRWACSRLRERKIVQAAEVSERGVWRLEAHRFVQAEPA